MKCVSLGGGAWPWYSFELILSRLIHEDISCEALLVLQSLVALRARHLWYGHLYSDSIEGSPTQSLPQIQTIKSTCPLGLLKKFSSASSSITAIVHFDWLRVYSLVVYDAQFLNHAWICCIWWMCDSLIDLLSVLQNHGFIKALTHVQKDDEIWLILLDISATLNKDGQTRLRNVL